MSGMDGAQEYEGEFRRFGHAERVAADPARSRRGRFAAWRAARRETKAAREAAAWDWADRIPPWAFGILHR